MDEEEYEEMRNVGAGLWHKYANELCGFISIIETDISAEDMDIADHKTKDEMIKLYGEEKYDEYLKMCRNKEIEKWDIKK